MCRLSVNTGREVAIRISSYQRVKKGYGVVGLSFHSEADHWLLTIEVLGYSRKNPHLPDGWDSGNSHRRGGQRLWKSRPEGGLNLRKSSAGVISTDSSRDSNV